MRRKIGLFLSSKPHDGGTFQYSQTVLEAVANLPKNYFSVSIAYSSEAWKQYLKSYNLRTMFVPGGFWRLFFDKVWRNILPIGLWRQICPCFFSLAKTVISENCDLWIFPSQDTLAYQLPVPALATVHDLMHRYEPQFPEVSAYGKYRRREQHYQNICKWAKGVLVDSEVGKQQLMESFGLEAEHIHVLPFIVPLYKHSCQTKNNFDSRYKLPSKFIFYPAHFWEHKNHKGLIRAIGMLKHKIPDLKIVLVGSKKNAYKSTVKLVQELNLSKDVIFLGYVPDSDMPEIYRRARALIMPTFFGPTNIPPLEAFAVGCPVAVSRIYGIPAQVGDAALLFDPKSVEEISNSIYKLWTDDKLCAELAKKGKTKAKEWGPIQFNKRVRQIILNVLKCK